MAPKFSRPTICSHCHRGGHRAFECPERSDAVPGAEPRGRGPPRDPCWTCGELHWSDECKVQQERKQKGACLICGSTEHWMRACPEYANTVKTPSAAVPANTLWCLRCGNSSHATAKCETKDPPVHFPPDDGVQRGCLHCGIFGHTMSECLRRPPQVQSEQDAKIATISGNCHSTATVGR